MLKQSFLVFSLLLAGALEAASTAEFSSAINVAGRQRMLTQKMAKESLLIKHGIDRSANEANLKKTMTLFDESLKSLQKGNSGKTIPAPPNDKIGKQLDKVAGLWATYKKSLESSDIKGVADINLNILKEMNKAVKQYEVASIKAGIKGSGKVINIAGRQRMLTQKMAKEVFFVAAEMDAAKNRKNLKSTIKLFDSSLDALKKGNKKMKVQATTDAGILAQLDTVSKLWAEYKTHLDKILATDAIDPAVLKDIAAINPKVLKEMHAAVGMFEKVSSQ